MPHQLKDKVVCITGGAQGIGKETARLLASLGAQVWIGDINFAAAQQTAKEIGLGVHAHVLDVTQPESFKAFLEAPQQPIAMLVNNAGVMHTGAFHEIPLEHHLREIAIDLSGIVIGMHLVLPMMIAQNDGHIVNIASMAGKFTLPGVATYTSTKFGVVALSRSVRNELRHTKVSISTILPSAVQTELLSGISTKGAPTYSPAFIAKEIVASYQHKQAEICVPRWASFTSVAEQILPESIFDNVKRLMIQDRFIKKR